MVVCVFVLNTPGRWTDARDQGTSFVATCFLSPNSLQKWTQGPGKAVYASMLSRDWTEEITVVERWGYDSWAWVCSLRLAKFAVDRLELPAKSFRSCLPMSCLHVSLSILGLKTCQMQSSSPCQPSRVRFLWGFWGFITFSRASCVSRCFLQVAGSEPWQTGFWVTLIASLEIGEMTKWWLTVCIKESGKMTRSPHGTFYHLKFAVEYQIDVLPLPPWKLKLTVGFINTVCMRRVLSTLTAF